jgi:hypothetical protein
MLFTTSEFFQTFTFYTLHHHRRITVAHYYFFFFFFFSSIPPLQLLRNFTMAPRVTYYQDLVVSEKDHDNAFTAEKMQKWEELDFSKEKSENDDDNDNKGKKTKKMKTWFKKDKKDKPLKLQTTGSDWTRKHLFACNVIVKTTTADLLPAYAKIDKKDLPPDIDGNIALFETGPSKEKRLEFDMHHHAGFPLGMIWTALENVKILQSATGQIVEHLPVEETEETEDTVRPQRSTRGSVQNASESVQDSESVTSSVPVSMGSSFKVTPKDSETRSEQHVVSLAEAVMRYILTYSQPSAKAGFCLREELRAEWTLQSKLLVNAIDDGGIAYQSLIDGRHDNWVALFEAKRQLYIKGDTGKAYIPDRVLAQMAYEAILAKAVRGRQAEKRYGRLSTSPSRC